MTPLATEAERNLAELDNLAHGLDILADTLNGLGQPLLAADVHRWCVCLRSLRTRMAGNALLGGVR